MKALVKVIKFIINHPISSRSKFLSIMRFLWWQIRCIFTNEKYYHQFTEHSFIIVSKGMTGATGNLYCGLHEYREMLFLLHFLRKEDVFVDVGANVGSFTILASAEIGAKSISVEPVPITYNQLLDNVKLNNISKNTVLKNIGLSSIKGQLLFSNESNTTLNHVVEISDSEKTIQVDVDTLDSIINDNQINLLKIDVEGFEYQVLKGANKALTSESLKAIIIELNGSGLHYGIADKQINDYLLSYGFKPYNYNPFDREIYITSPGDHDNLIYLRDIDFIKNRLKNAPRFKILNLEI